MSPSGEDQQFRLLIQRIAPGAGLRRTWRVAALRLVRLAGRDLAAWAAFFEPFGRPDITAQSIREHYSVFIAQAYTKLVV